MLTIKDLAVSQTLDAKAMSSISGGFNANLSRIGEFNQSGILGGNAAQNLKQQGEEANTFQNTTPQRKVQGR